jgi:hypothetical protein
LLHFGHVENRSFPAINTHRAGWTSFCYQRLSDGMQLPSRAPARVNMLRSVC